MIGAPQPGRHCAPNGGDARAERVCSLRVRSSPAMLFIFALDRADIFSSHSQVCHNGTYGVSSACRVPRVASGAEKECS